MLEMRLPLVSVGFSSMALALTLACASSPVGDDENGGAAGSGGTSAGGNSMSGSGGGVIPSTCSGALRQALGLVDEVSTAPVVLLSEARGELEVYVDATAGGIGGQDSFPWVYISLASGKAVALSDLDALSSNAWDLAFKRFLIRSNGGDSGPGQGGALRVALPWEAVNEGTQGDRALPTESWFDGDCRLSTDDQGELLTTFSGWSEYDPATHVLAPADVVYLTQGGDGTRYKVAVLDYYSNADGTHGKTAGRYKLRVAKLP
jgi:hypothetical protein